MVPQEQPQQQPQQQPCGFCTTMNQLDTIGSGYKENSQHSSHQSMLVRIDESNVGKSDMLKPPRPSRVKSLGSAKSIASSSSKSSRGRNADGRSSYKGSKSAAKDFARAYIRAKRLSGSDSTASCSSSFSFTMDGSIKEEEPSIAEDASYTYSPGARKAKWQKTSSNNFDDQSQASGKMSVSDMRQMVLDSLPAEIRQQIPASAWERIFSDDDTVGSDKSPLVRRLRRGTEEDVGDLVSIISNIVTRRRPTGGGASVSSSVSGLTREDKSQFASPHPKQKNRVTLSHQIPVSPLPTGFPGEAPVAAAPRTTERTSTRKTKKKKKSLKKSVSFDKVQVRNYGYILTINPSVTSGPSIGLGWDFDAKKDEHYSIEMFESSKEMNVSRTTKDMMLSREERENLLVSLGYSRKEIASVVRRTIRLKHQRKVTVQNLKMSPVEEFLERTSRRVKRVLRFTGGRNRDNGSQSGSLNDPDQTSVASSAA